MPITLKFYCSYLDEAEYEIFGAEATAVGVSRVSIYNGSERTLDYFLTIFNHNGDESSFERNVLSRQGGAVLRSPLGARWTPELWQAFEAHRKESREAQWAEYCERCRTRYNETPEPWEPLAVLQPKYFDHAAGTYVVEPFAEKGKEDAEIHQAV